jgi:hypothetical protein
LVAPPAAKKKTTSKKALIEVTFHSSWTQDHFFIWQISSCVISDQNLATINSFRTCQCPICWCGPDYLTFCQDHYSH